MSKYVIKNCPAYEYDEDWDRHICKRHLTIYETTSDTCPECEDCIVKQTYNLCQKICSTDATALSVFQILDAEEVKNKQ